MRIVVLGHSGTGKTTLGRKLAKEHGLTLHSTDELIGMKPDKQLDQICKWLDEDDYVIEGTWAAMGLRRWKEKHPKQAAPVDVAHMLTVSKRELTDGQISQRRQVQGVFNQIRHWLDDSCELQLEKNESSYEDREHILWDFTGEEEHEEHEEYDDDEQ